jgi:hypothetical protein
MPMRQCIPIGILFGSDPKSRRQFTSLTALRRFIGSSTTISNRSTLIRAGAKVIKTGTGNHLVCHRKCRNDRYFSRLERIKVRNPVENRTDDRIGTGKLDAARLARSRADRTRRKSDRPR